MHFIGVRLHQLCVLKPVLFMMNHSPAIKLYRIRCIPCAFQVKQTLSLVSVYIFGISKYYVFMWVHVSNNIYEQSPTWLQINSNLTQCRLSHPPTFTKCVRFVITCFMGIVQEPKHKLFVRLKLFCYKIKHASVILSYVNNTFNRNELFSYKL